MTLKDLESTLGQTSNPSVVTCCHFIRLATKLYKKIKDISFRK